MIRSSKMARRSGAVLLLGAVALLAAACSSAATANGTSSTSTIPSRPQVPSASGTIATVTGTSMEAQNPESGQTTVNWTSSTSFSQTTSASASAVTTGECVTATGQAGSGGGVTASRVMISQPNSSGSCSKQDRDKTNSPGSRPKRFTVYRNG